MDELPTEVAVELGRIAYFAGHADYYLGLLAPVEQRAQGLSGERLTKKLKRVAMGIPALQEILDAYGPMYDGRNVLFHGTHRFASGVLWTWYIPIGKKGDVARSWQHRVEHLRDMADSWQRLGDAAHELVRASETGADAGKEE